MANNPKRGITSFCRGQLPAGGLGPAVSRQAGYDPPVSEVAAKEVKTQEQPRVLELVDIATAFHALVTEGKSNRSS
jgi:hypothetical protein